MVFHDARKRRTAPTPKAPITSINNLPMELIVQILGDTPTRDLLKLRETSRIFANAGTEMLRKRLQVLYIHPTKASLRKAIEICNSDLCLEIKEVCLLGKVPWHEIRQSLLNSDHRDITEELHDRQTSRRGEFRAWPSIMPKAKPESGRGYSEWGNAYRELLDALSKLPKAYALSFASCCLEVGFNHVSEDTIDAHAAKIARRTPATRLFSAKNREEPAFSDADAIFSILRFLPFKIKGLRITEDLPFVTNISRSLHGDLNQPLKATLSSLTTIVFEISAGWDDTDWQKTCRNILKFTISLENLTVCLKHNIDVRKVYLESSVYNLLRGPSFPRLKRLTLRAVLPDPRDGRMWRPVPCVFDMATFLLTHRITLQEVVLLNLTFSYPAPPTTTLDQINVILNLADGHTGVDPISGKEIVDKKAAFRLFWAINNYTRDPRCKKIDNGAGHNCKNDCGILCPSDFNGLTTAELATLAGNLGVPLIKEKGVWEFTED